MTNEDDEMPGLPESLYPRINANLLGREKMGTAEENIPRELLVPSIFSSLGLPRQQQQASEIPPSYMMAIAIRTSYAMARTS